MNNVEAFAKLRKATEKSGTVYLNHNVYKSDQEPGQPVARGFDKIKNSVIEHKGLRLRGILAVRALVGLEGVNNPFNYQGDGNAEWLIRTRLTIEIPDAASNMLGIEKGEHTASTAYLLADKDPAAIDAGDRRVLSALYFHTVPIIGEKQFTDDDLDAPRTVLLTQWIAEGAHGDAMTMLSPTSEGSVSQTELPRTIDWLLADESAALEKPMPKQKQMQQTKNKQHNNK